MNLYCCANYLMCQRILILQIVLSRFAIYLCVLCASVVNPLNLVAITEKNQAVPSSALRFFYFNRIRYTTDRVAGKFDDFSAIGYHSRNRLRNALYEGKLIDETHYNARCC